MQKSKNRRFRENAKVGNCRKLGVILRFRLKNREGKELWGENGAFGTEFSRRCVLAIHTRPEKAQKGGKTKNRQIFFFLLIIIPS